MRIRALFNALRVTALVRRLSVLFLLSLVAACGYSEEEWGQKVRENEALRSELTSEKQARKKCESDHAAANQQIDELKKQLTERGVSLDSMSASLAEQKKALEEYGRRAEQLDAIRKRFEVLQTKLKKLTTLGLKVEVRNNRMLIQLPGDILFDSGKEKLKEEGEKILLQVAEVIRSDSDLSKRRFQVAGHTDAKPLQGGQFKDNWGLSAMRARSVLLLLTGPGGLNPAFWSAAGYADTDPVAGNDSDDGRQKNRRVELVVQPDVSEMLNLQTLAK